MNSYDTSGSIGVAAAGQSPAMLYSSNTDWGITSKSGGTLLSYTQAGSVVQLGAGNPIVIAAGTASNHAVNLGQISQNTLVGEMKMWPSNTLPAQYIWANGQAVSRATYVKLFAAYGIQFGGGGWGDYLQCP